MPNEHNTIINHQRFYAKNKQLFNNVSKILGQAPEGFNINELDIAKLFSVKDDAGSLFERYTLSSGIDINFVLVTIPYEDLEVLTEVSFDINGRDQDALTPDSVKEITASIRKQQYYPAIGFPRDNNRIEILDGSRRRKAAIYAKVGLNVLVAEREISTADAKMLAKDLQTAKEHNLREKGRVWAAMLESGNMRQEDIAKLYQVSRATVGRAIKAASIPDAILSIIPDLNTLTTDEWLKLYDLAVKHLPQNKLDIKDYVESIITSDDFKRLKNGIDSDFQDEVLTLILTSFKSIKKQINTTKSEKLEIYGKRTYLKTSNNLKAYKLEFGEIPRELAEQLKAVNLEIMSNFYQDK